MKRNKLRKNFLIVILIAMAISPAFALGEGNRNLLLIGVMSLSPIVILRNRKFKKNERLLLVFLATIILFPLLFHPESMRWSTVLYSCMFGLTFIAYDRLLHKNQFTVWNYEKLLKYLIYGYFIVLLIQQFCVLTGLPIFNLSNYDPNTPWKLNALAAEPSHSARIVALLMYCYITIKELIANRKYNFSKDFNKDKWVWIAFIWTMVTMGSGTAFLFILIVLLKFIRFKNLIPLIVVFGAIVLIINLTGVTAFERTSKIFIATLTLDETAIISVDHSASIRIIPIIILIKMIDFTSINGLFGYGIDFVSSFLYEKLPGVEKGISGGGLFQVWIEYGFISFAIFVVFSLFSTYKKGDYLSLVFWFFLVFLYGINNQMVWLCIILLLTNKHFFKIKDKLSHL